MLKLRRLCIYIMTMLILVTGLASNIVGKVALAETSGPMDFRHWLQEGEPFGPLAYFGHNVGQWVGPNSVQSFERFGCFVVSAAIQIKRSGADPRPNFDPVLHAKDLWANGGMTSDGLFMSPGFRNIYGEAFMQVTPIYTNGSVEFVPVTTHNRGVPIAHSTPDFIRDMVLRFGYEEGLFMVIRGHIHSGSMHFMSVDRVENGEVFFNDPITGLISMTEVNQRLMREGGYTYLMLFSSNVGRFYDMDSGVSTNNNLRPTEDEIRDAVIRWDGVSIPGLPPEYDPSWSYGLIPPGFVPASYHVQGISDWISDVNLHRLNQQTQGIRTSFMIMGFLLIGYAVVLVIAGVIARVFSYDIVQFVTFKYYKYNPLDNKGQKSLTFSQVLSMAFFTLVLGVFILNGTLFRIILMLFYWSLLLIEMF